VTWPGRTLWLLRHAKTVAEPPPGGDDFDRVLAPRGRRDAEALGRLFAQHGEEFSPLGGEPIPQVAFVSPAARTMATVDRVLTNVTPPPRRMVADDLYGAEPEVVLDHLRALGDDVSSAMVVGHNPTTQALALGLLAIDDANREEIVRRSFPTCALAIYRLEVARWVDVGAECAILCELLTPPFDEN
jgi:phosphohistidine phosphatase